MSYKTPLKLTEQVTANCRVLRSSTALQMMDQFKGYCDPSRFGDYVKHHQEIARNTGIFMTEHYFTHRRGIAHVGQFGIGYYAGENDEANNIIKNQHIELVKGLKEANPDCVIIAQLANCGDVKSFTPMFEEEAKKNNLFNVNTCTDDDINQIIAGFVSGARMAKEAGYDGAQIHGGHGYLLAQSMSPAFNRRFEQEDVEGRFNFLLGKVIKAVRAEVGDDFLLGIKLQSIDYVPNGIDIEKTVRAVDLMAKFMHFIEITGGLSIPGAQFSTIRKGNYSAYYLDVARRLKELPSIKENDVKICLTGGFVATDFVEGGLANKLIDEGIDIIGLSRQYIRYPNWLTDLENGVDFEDLKKHNCARCNGCFSGKVPFGRCIFNRQK